MQFMRQLAHEERIEQGLVVARKKLSPLPPTRSSTVAGPD
jgi:hypothetical protein